MSKITLDMIRAYADKKGLQLLEGSAYHDCVLALEKLESGDVEELDQQTIELFEEQPETFAPLKEAWEEQRTADDTSGDEDEENEDA